MSNGPHAALLTPHENQDFESFSHLVQVVFDTEEGDEHMLPAMHTAAAARHFFVVDMDVLPIERSVFECLQMSNERARRLRGREVDDTILVQLEDTFRMNQLLATAFHHVYQAEGPRWLGAGKKQQKAEKHPKLLDFEELLLISSVPAQDPWEKALEKEHHGERFNPS